MLTVAICTHARPLDTLTCLQAIDRQRGETPLPILIVDNASPPSDSKILRHGIANLRDVEYRYEPRPGLSVARNLAWTAASTEWLAYIDDDAIPNDNWVETARLLVSSVRDDVAIIGGTVTPLWPSEWGSDKVEPSRVGPYWRSLLSLIDTERQIESDQSPNFVGCNMVIRRATLAALGGFNVALGRTPGSLLGGEEGDLADRARARGMHTQFSAELGVQHRIHAERLTLSWLRARADAEGQRLWFAAPSKRRLLKSVASLPALACLSALESYQNRVINDNARLWRNIGYVKAGTRQLRRMSTP